MSQNETQIKIEVNTLADLIEKACCDYQLDDQEEIKDILRILYYFGLLKTERIKNFETILGQENGQN